MEKGALFLKGFKRISRKSSSLCNESFIGKRKPKGGRNDKESRCTTRAGFPTRSPENKGSGKVWKRISLFAAVPTIFALSAFVMLTHDELEQPPFVKYEHLRIRKKRFPWGDGNKTFFHNRRQNPLPDGYEEELEADTQEGQEGQEEGGDVPIEIKDDKE